MRSSAKGRQMVNVRVVVTGKGGLDARRASLLARDAGSFESVIRIRKMDEPRPPANARSAVQVLVLGVQQGDEVELIAEGSDERQAAALLKQLIDTDFAGL